VKLFGRYPGGPGALSTKGHVCAARVLRIRGGSALVEHCDGRVRCWCGVMCDVACEQCEFADERRAASK
jgi:hypothetical protein